jgi:isoquinoline 1-oxidoreductase beta subunit
MQSSIVYGLSALLYGGVEIDRGVPQASNFHDQPVLRLSQMPRIEVDIVPSEAAPGGVGEPALPPLMPAVVNGWFRLTGKRVRRLPMGSSAGT